MRIAYAEYPYIVPGPILLFYKIALLLAVQYRKRNFPFLSEKRVGKNWTVDQVGVVFRAVIVGNSLQQAYLIWISSRHSLLDLIYIMIVFGYKFYIINRLRRVARNLQWGSCLGGLGAKPPAAGGTGVWGLCPSARKFCIVLQK